MTYKSGEITDIQCDEDWSLVHVKKANDDQDKITIKKVEVFKRGILQHSHNCFDSDSCASLSPVSFVDNCDEREISLAYSEDFLTVSRDPSSVTCIAAMCPYKLEMRGKSNPHDGWPENLASSLAVTMTTLNEMSYEISQPLEMSTDVGWFTVEFEMPCQLSWESMKVEQTTVGAVARIRRFKLSRNDSVLHDQSCFSNSGTCVDLAVSESCNDDDGQETIKLISEGDSITFTPEKTETCSRAVCQYKAGVRAQSSEEGTTLNARIKLAGRDYETTISPSHEEMQLMWSEFIEIPCNKDVTTAEVEIENGTDRPGEVVVESVLVGMGDSDPSAVVDVRCFFTSDSCQDFDKTPSNDCPGASTSIKLSKFKDKLTINPDETTTCFTGPIA